MQLFTFKKDCYNEPIVTIFHVITSFKCKSYYTRGKHTCSMHIYAVLFYIGTLHFSKILTYLYIMNCIRLAILDLTRFRLIMWSQNFPSFGYQNYQHGKIISITYFFKPYIHPAKSFVILPESIVDTHAFSNVVANL